MYTPKILVTCISEDKSISFAGCVAQFFFSAGLAYSECYLLAAMTYDHLYAIPKATALLSGHAHRTKCIFYSSLIPLVALLTPFIVTKGPSALKFCSNNVIDDFFCYIPPLVKLVCGRKKYLPGCAVLCPRLQRHHPYCAHPGPLALHHCHHPEDPLTQGHHKAFSTCSSHLISITLFCGSVLYAYSRPQSSYSLTGRK